MGRTICTTQHWNVHKANFSQFDAKLEITVSDYSILMQNYSGTNLERLLYVGQLDTSVGSCAPYAMPSNGSSNEIHLKSLLTGHISLPVSLA